MREIVDLRTVLKIWYRSSSIYFDMIDRKKSERMKGSDRLEDLDRAISSFNLSVLLEARKVILKWVESFVRAIDN